MTLNEEDIINIYNEAMTRETGMPVRLNENMIRWESYDWIIVPRETFIDTYAIILILKKVQFREYTEWGYIMDEVRIGAEFSTLDIFDGIMEKVIEWNLYF